jgi:hypothetical protein
MRDHDRDGLPRPSIPTAQTPRRAGGSGPIDNSTNRSPIGQLGPLERPPPGRRTVVPPTAAFAQRGDPGRIPSRPPAAPDLLVTHHDRWRSTCDVLH